MIVGKQYKGRNVNELVNVRRSNPETNLEEELRGHFGEEEEESGSLLIEVSAGGNAQCIQHPLCHLAYATNLQNTVTTLPQSYTSHYLAAFEKIQCEWPGNKTAQGNLSLIHLFTIILLCCTINSKQVMQAL